MSTAGNQLSITQEVHEYFRIVFRGIQTHTHVHTSMYVCFIPMTLINVFKRLPLPLVEYLFKLWFLYPTHKRCGA